MEQDFANKIIGGCRLETLLGRGGMGSVYKAHHLNLDIPIAVKFLDKGLANSQELIDRFILEARAAARLDSPYIVRVFQVGAEENLYFIQMEFVEGESLAQKLKREAPLPLETALLYLYQISMGLAAAHQANIVHRDIKPENILISSNKGLLKITDFGLAKSLQSSANLTRSGEILGTPYYLSPEQCEGGSTDARSDIYSLGVTFFYMLTGKLPFQGETPIGIAVARLRFDPPLPRGLRPDIPEDVEKMIMKMMARAPEGRYSSMEPILQEIVDMMPRYGVTFPRQATVAMPMMPLPASQDTKTGVRPVTEHRTASAHSLTSAQSSDPTLVGIENKENSLATDATDAEDVIPSSPTMALGTAPAKKTDVTILEGGGQQATLATATPVHTVKREVSHRSETRAAAKAPVQPVAAPVKRTPVPTPAVAAVGAPALPPTAPVKRTGSWFGRWLFDIACVAVIGFVLFAVTKKQIVAQVYALRNYYAPQLNNAEDWSGYQKIAASLPYKNASEMEQAVKEFLSQHANSRYAHILRDLDKELKAVVKNKPENVEPGKEIKPDNPPQQPDKPDEPHNLRDLIRDNITGERLKEIVHILTENNRSKNHAKSLEALEKFAEQPFRVQALLRNNAKIQEEMIKSFNGYNTTVLRMMKKKSSQDAAPQFEKMKVFFNKTKQMMSLGTNQKINNMLEETKKALEAAKNKKQGHPKEQDPDEGE
jgi:serine/threonine protein kinase